MWLTYRCFRAKGSEVMPIFGDYGLARQIGTVEYSRPRRFRGMAEQWLGTIRAIWPECPLTSATTATISLFAEVSRSFDRAP
jgi:hypothetical protein